jgi:uncharacterized protein YbaR (Trm112 family)
MATPALTALLACPRCELPLHQYPDDSFGCGSCGLQFPALDGVPCLFAEPAATLAEWRQRLHFAQEKLLQDAAALQAELQNPRLQPLTAGSRCCDVCRSASRLGELLQPAALHNSQTSCHPPLQTRLPIGQGRRLLRQYPPRLGVGGDERNR